MAETVLPCLKEPAWGRDGLSLCRRLWADGGSATHTPWVGFGYDHPHSFEFLPVSATSEGRSALQIEREALRNLRLRKLAWERASFKLGWFRKLEMLTCQGDFLSAEKILDESFMRDAQARLRARGLLAGVPHRGVLAVIDGEADHRRVAAFGALVVTQYLQAQAAPISAALFALKDGRIVGTVEAIAQAMEKQIGQADALEDEEEDENTDEGDPDEPYLMTMVVQNGSGREDVHVMAGGNHAGRIAGAVVSALAASLTKHLPRPEFSGCVKAVILGHTPPAVRAELATLEAHLCGIAAETSHAAGKPVQVSVEFQDSKF